MMEMAGYFASIAAVFLSGLSAFFVPGKARGIVYAVLAGIALIAGAVPAVSVLAGGVELSAEPNLGFPLGFVRFALDPLSAFFGILILLGNFLVGLYSIGYMRSFDGKKSRKSFYFLLSLLFASMLLITAAAHALFFCILWEIMSVSSFLLVAYEHEKKEAVDSSVYYLVAMQLGFVFILGGFLLASSRAGSFDFRSIETALRRDTFFAFFSFVLFFIGFGTKSGFVPFHT